MQNGTFHERALSFDGTRTYNVWRVVDDRLIFDASGPNLRALLRAAKVAT